MKQKKPASDALDEAKASVGESSLLGALDAGLEQGSGLGNAEAQARMDGTERVDEVALDVVRDLALPWLERGALALRVLPEEPERVERRIALLEATALDHRQDLVEQLRREQASADAIRDAVLSHFGADTSERRSSLVQTMDRAAELLQTGSEQGGQWVSGTIALDMRAGVGLGASRQAELMLDEAGRHAVRETGVDIGEDPGKTVRNFCLAVFLAFHLDEEEEEEVADSAEAEIA